MASPLGSAHLGADCQDLGTEVLINPGGGPSKVGSPPVPAGMAQTPATTVAAVAQGTPPTVVPFNQLQPDRDSVCGHTGAPFRACGRSAADTAALRRSGIGVIL